MFISAPAFREKDVSISMKEKIVCFLLHLVDLLIFFCFIVLKYRKVLTPLYNRNGTNFSPCIDFFLELQLMLCFFLEKKSLYDEYCIQHVQSSIFVYYQQFNTGTMHGNSIVNNKIMP